MIMERQRPNPVLEEVDHESIIYSELRDYLNSNKTMRLDEIIPYLTGRFSRSSININKMGIVKILNSFIDRNIIVEGSKLTIEDVLANEKRREIFKFIEQNPGTYYYNIVKELDMASHVVVWHVEILLDFNFIKTIQEDNHDIYFSDEILPEKAKRLYYLVNEKSNKILTYLESNDMGITKTEISKNLAMHPKTVKKYIKALKDYQLIHSIKDRNRTLYFSDINEK